MSELTEGENVSGTINNSHSVVNDFVYFDAHYEMMGQSFLQTSKKLRNINFIEGTKAFLKQQSKDALVVYRAWPLAPLPPSSDLSLFYSHQSF